MTPTRSEPDWAALRALFPAARRVAYLDTASFGPGPTPVREVLDAHLDAWSEGREGWRAWEAAAERAREGLARLIGARPDSVALLPAVASAAAQVASSLEPGSNVVVGEQEFRSNLFPWLAQERRGVEVRLVPFRAGRVAAEDLLAATDARTAVLAVSHVQSANGYRVDLPRLVEACAGRATKLFVDATQSAGALRLDVEGIDFVAAAAYKWLLAPRGTAFLYADPRHVAGMTPLQPGWKTPDDPYARYYGPPLEPAPTATRFDVSLAWPCWVGCARSVELILEVGIDAIEERDLALARRFREGLPAIGLAPLFGEAESSQVVGLEVPDPVAVQEALAAERVVAAVRDRYLRASFHFFNDETDVDRILACLARAT